jgi:hypothetical protein
MARPHNIDFLIVVALAGGKSSEHLPPRDRVVVREKTRHRQRREIDDST